MTSKTTKQQDEELKRVRDQVNKEFQAPMNKAMGELKDFAVTAVKSWELESEQITQMWTKAAELHLVDATKELLLDYLAEARETLNPDGHYVRGQGWEADTDVEWIWDQWIAKGFFHTITAMQKVGKSTFFLDFIKSICDGNDHHLNFSLFSEKKDLEFVLIGPDMGKRLWGTYGVKSQLLKVDHATNKLNWHKQIAHVFTEEDEFGLGKTHIARYVEIAQEINARGKHPVFVMDSYSAMLAMAGIKSEENTSQFAIPLRELKLALGRTGATSLMLHHSSLTSSKRSTEASNSGHQAFNRVPDQLLTLKWLAEAGIDGTRNDRRIVLSAAGRTGASVSPQLLEQSLDWGWSNHGDVNDALRIQVALDERDRLGGDDAICFDLLNTRTGNGQGTTSNELQELRETVTAGKGNWSLAKINRLLRKLERKGLAVIDGSKPRPGDLGGRAANIWWTFERVTPKSEGVVSGCFAVSRVTGAAPCFAEDLVSHVSHDSSFGDNPPSVRQMVEDANGQNGLIVVELLPGTCEVKVQEFGNASAPIKQRRWRVDVFPCGTYAKANPPVIDMDEEL